MMPNRSARTSKAAVWVKRPLVGRVYRDALRPLRADSARLPSSLSALITQKLMDREGRTVAEIGSVDEDLDGRLVRQASQHMQLEILWLRTSIDRMRQRFQPTEADLRAYLVRSPVFDASKAPILECGLAAYFAGEAIVAVPTLIPQVEDALRNLVRLAGSSDIQAAPAGRPYA